jgi:hypothetical protein
VSSHFGTSLNGVSSMRRGIMNSGSESCFLRGVRDGQLFAHACAVRVDAAFEMTKMSLIVSPRRASSIPHQNGVPPLSLRTQTRLCSPCRMSREPSQRTTSLSSGVAWLMNVASRPTYPNRAK